MTTIAWDGETVAADKGAWICGYRQVCKKLHLMHLHLDKNSANGVDCIVAFMGSRPYAEAMVNALRDGTDFPDPKDYEMDGNTDVAFIWPEGRTPFTISSLGVHMTVHGTWWAGGAGREFAAGVLAQGGTACEAIGLATVHTDYAAHGVDFLRHA